MNSLEAMRAKMVDAFDTVAACLAAALGLPSPVIGELDCEARMDALEAAIQDIPGVRKCSDVIRYAIKAAKESARNPCPCTLTAPCTEDCTCIQPLSSHGCRRCCTYGSVEQQKAKAEWLASAINAAMIRTAPMQESMYAWWNVVGKPFTAEEMKSVSAVVADAIATAVKRREDGKNEPPSHAYILASRILATQNWNK